MYQLTLEQANLISPVKAPPFPTQEFWADISILSVSEFFTWSMYRKGGATTTSAQNGKAYDNQI